MPRASGTSLSPNRSPFVRQVALGWFVLVMAVLLVLRYSDIPLGQGSFQYRLSPFHGIRIQRALCSLPLAAIALLALSLAGQRSKRRLAVALALVSIVLLGAWTWWAPPHQITQHSLNLRSPSHEGAFVIEAEHAGPVGEYLRGFDLRIQHSIKQMMGTRVISNPPGTTLAFIAIEKIPSPRWLDRMLAEDSNIPPADVPLVANSLQISVALTTIWILSAAAMYAAARQVLAMPGAMLATLIAWFNPSTVHFTPGKDPAQLLFVGMMLWCWLRARKTSNSPVRLALRVAFGMVLAISATVGLVHFWVAAAMVLATIWDDLAEHGRRVAGSILLDQLVPVIAGFMAVVVGMYLLCGWNLLATIVAVSRRYVEVQRELQLSRPIWFMIGLPMFLLFLGPGVVAFAALALRRRRAIGLGMRLAIATALIMLVCYLVGVTYELPRLWVVFLPTLSIGLVSATPLAHATRDGKAIQAMLFIASMQILFTVAHWSQLDARESEYRLLANRLFT